MADWPYSMSEAELTALAHSGWADTPQVRIPKDWRRRKPPGPKGGPRKRAAHARECRARLIREKRETTARSRRETAAHARQVHQERNRRQERAVILEALANGPVSDSTVPLENRFAAFRMLRMVTL